MFHYLYVAFSVQIKNKVGMTLAKEEALRITLNLDGTPMISKSHTHPSHSQTSRLLTSSLSLGIPVPRTTRSHFIDLIINNPMSLTLVDSNHNKQNVQLNLDFDL